MWKNNLRFVGTIVPTPGKRTNSERLSNGVLTDYVDLTLRGTFTVTTAGTALRNRGSLAACFDECVVSDAGVQRVNARGNVLRFVNEMAVRSAKTAKRVIPASDGTVPTGTYTLEEKVRVHFAWPEQVRPAETSFAETKNTNAILVTLLESVDPVAQLMAGGVATLTGVSVDVEQGTALEGNRPLFLPYIHSDVLPINGAVSAAKLNLTTSDRIRALVISQEVVLASGAVVEVSDILSSLVLRGDRLMAYGPEPVPFRNLLLAQEEEFGGAVVNNGAHLGLLFQRFGRLASNLEPAMDTNTRLEFAGAPSATAGQSQVRVTSLELIEVPGLTVPRAERGF